MVKADQARDGMVVPILDHLNNANDKMAEIDAAIRKEALASASFTVKFGHP